MENLKNYYLSDVGATLGEYMDGVYLYEIIATINAKITDKSKSEDIPTEGSRSQEASSRSQEASLSRYTEVYDLLTNNNVDAKKIQDFIFDMMIEYENLKKEYFEEIDQNRRILSETFSAIKCDYCGSHKTKVSVVQMRSSDEPATMFVQCQNPLCKQFNNIYKRSE